MKTADWLLLVLALTLAFAFCGAPKSLAQERVWRPEGRVFATAADVRRAEVRALLARSDHGQDLDPAVVLARVCWKEANVDARDDCRGIRVVLSRVGRGDVVRGARLYTPAVFLPHRLGRRAYIASLHGDGRLPRHWLPGLSWTSVRGRWLELVAFCRAVLQQPLWCDAANWGDRGADYVRALTYGWIQVDCGVSRNMFWRARTRQERLGQEP
jgi:hypothetical protein